MTTTSYHEPVMVSECIKGLAINPDGKYVDATYGGGGHSQKILKNLTKGHLYGFDQDTVALQNASKDKRLTFIEHNFQYLKRFLKYYDAIPINGLLADLGVSSHQINDSKRGFAFRFDTDLDMRMDRNSTLTAARIINTYSETNLQHIFGMYGEIKNARTLARTIISARSKNPVETSGQLLEVIQSCVNKRNRNQYYAQLFQALRIEVNNELKALEELLVQCKEVIAKGGRLVVISYHSLEDRLVKNFIAKGNFEGRVEKDFYGNVNKPFKAVNKRPIMATSEEVNRNPRARSAKLRIAEKI